MKLIRLFAGKASPAQIATRQLVVLIFVCLATFSAAQEVNLSYANTNYNLDSLKTLVGQNKILPKGYELPALIALSRYPELKDTRVEFRFGNKKSLLLSTITFQGFFQHSSKRSYIIHLRTNSDAKLSPALFKNLTFDGQIASLAHELAHTLEFTRKSFGGMVKVACRHLSKKAIDRQELGADMQVLKRGFGFQMYSWRTSTAKAFGDRHKNSDKPVHERYMGPETTLKTMLKLPLYETNFQRIGDMLLHQKTK